MTVSQETAVSDGLLGLILSLRNELNRLNRIEEQPDLNEISEEAESYFTNNRNVFLIRKENKAIGYAVLKWEDDIAWLDWMFMKNEYRRKGIASFLFDYVESYAINKGSDQLYVWVHPDNDPMLKFLNKKEYNVLNLIEIKKNKKEISKEIQILNNKYTY